MLLSLGASHSKGKNWPSRNKVAETETLTQLQQTQQQVNGGGGGGALAFDVAVAPLHFDQLGNAAFLCPLVAVASAPFHRPRLPPRPLSAPPPTTATTTANNNTNAIIIAITFAATIFGRFARSSPIVCSRFFAPAPKSTRETHNRLAADVIIAAITLATTTAGFDYSLIDHHFRTELKLPPIRWKTKTFSETGRIR